MFERLTTQNRKEFLNGLEFRKNEVCWKAIGETSFTLDKNGNPMDHTKEVIKKYLQHKVNEERKKTYQKPLSPKAVKKVKYDHF